MGKIATDIRLQQFSGGDKAKVKASFLLVVPRPIRDAEPDWVRVETWGRQAENLVRFNGKGSRIGVTGRLRSQFYNPDGKPRGGELRSAVVADEIVYLGQPQPRQTDPQTAPAAAGASTERRR